MAYGLAKVTSKNPDSFGKGNIEGVAAPETGIAEADPAILAALAGWSVVEGLVMRVVRKFDQI